MNWKFEPHQSKVWIENKERAIEMSLNADKKRPANNQLELFQATEEHHGQRGVSKWQRFYTVKAQKWLSALVYVISSQILFQK